jgi:hypothetical protein
MTTTAAGQEEKSNADFFADFQSILGLTAVCILLFVVIVAVLFRYCKRRSKTGNRYQDQDPRFVAVTGATFVRIDNCNSGSSTTSTECEHDSSLKSDEAECHRNNNAIGLCNLILLYVVMKLPECLLHRRHVSSAISDLDRQHNLEMSPPS